MTDPQPLPMDPLGGFPGGPATPDPLAAGSLYDAAPHVPVIAGPVDLGPPPAPVITPATPESPVAEPAAATSPATVRRPLVNGGPAGGHASPRVDARPSRAADPAGAASGLLPATAPDVARSRPSTSSTLPVPSRLQLHRPTSGTGGAKTVNGSRGLIGIGAVIAIFVVGQFVIASLDNGIGGNAGDFAGDVTSDFADDAAGSAEHPAAAVAAESFYDSDPWLFRLGDTEAHADKVSVSDGEDCAEAVHHDIAESVECERYIGGIYERTDLNLTMWQWVLVFPDDQHATDAREAVMAAAQDELPQVFALTEPMTDNDSSSAQLEAVDHYLLVTIGVEAGAQQLSAAAAAVTTYFHSDHQAALMWQ
jgi:hypothetical protein